MASPKMDLGGNSIVVDGVYVGATAPGQAGTLLSGSELTVLDGITPGTADASKALVLNSSKGISTITSATVTTLTNTTLNNTTTNSTTVNAGADASAGTVNSFPSTTASGKLILAAVNSAGAFNTTISNASMGQSAVVSIPDPGSATANFVLDKANQTIAGNKTFSGTTTHSGATTLTGLTTVNGGTTFAAGTNTVPPIQLVSGTNLTTAVGGAIEFDGAAYYGTSNGSTKQGMIDVAQYIIQATEPTADNNGGLDSNAIAAFFTASNGAVTLVSGKTYMFEGIYMLTNTGTTAHTWATAFGGAATFTATGTNYQAWGTSGGTAGTAATGGAQGFVAGFTATGATTKILAVTPSSTSATEQVMICVAGTLVCANGGTLIPSLCASARPGASGTPGVLHKAGSFFKIWQVPTLGTVGNWS